MATFRSALRALRRDGGAAGLRLADLLQADVDEDDEFDGGDSDFEDDGDDDEDCAGDDGEDDGGAGAESTLPRVNTTALGRILRSLVRTNDRIVREGTQESAKRSQAVQRSEAAAQIRRIAKRHRLRVEIYDADETAITPAAVAAPACTASPAVTFTSAPVAYAASAAPAAAQLFSAAVASPVAPARAARAAPTASSTPHAATSLSACAAPGGRLFCAALGARPQGKPMPCRVAPGASRRRKRSSVENQPDPPPPLGLAIGDVGGDVGGGVGRGVGRGVGQGVGRGVGGETSLPGRARKRAKPSTASLDASGQRSGARATQTQGARAIYVVTSATRHVARSMESGKGATAEGLSSHRTSTGLLAPQPSRR